MNTLDWLLEMEQKRITIGKDIYYHFASEENAGRIRQEGFRRTGEILPDTLKINEVIKEVLGEGSQLYQLRKGSFFFANVAANPKFFHNSKIVYATGLDEMKVSVLNMDKANAFYKNQHMSEEEKIRAVHVYNQSLVSLKDYDGSYYNPEFLYFSERIPAENVREHYEDVSVKAG